MLVTMIVFILVFSIVVISHELGHFLIAKLNGIRVLEFAIGMGPVLLKFTKGETRYVLRLLPIGGACMFEGEDGVYSILSYSCRNQYGLYYLCVVLRLVGAWT